MTVALFIFRRDFRLEGNPAWSRCASWARANGAKIAPCFVFSDLQIDSDRNPYFSQKAYSAMLQCMDTLDGRLDGKLARFRVRGGERDTSLLRSLSDDNDVRGVFFNSDVTPFARKRDEEVRRWCSANDVFCDGGRPGEGYLLWPAGTIHTKSGGTVPKTFSAFFRYTRDKDLPVPPESVPNPETVKLPAPRGFSARGIPKRVELVGVPPSHAVVAAVEEGRFDKYGTTRSDYQIPTTRLSVHLKFGVVDPVAVMALVRERGDLELARQILWREFYYHLAFGYPNVLDGQNNAHIRPDRQRVAWPPLDSKRRKDADSWYHGCTGESLVDDAMRELRRTGYIHNRLRMVVASFFTRDLRLDWREGERRMATLLVDYDPAQNSGGWQSMDAQIPGQEIKASTQERKYGKLRPAARLGT